MHLHESLLVNITSQILQTEFSYSHKKGCVSHAVQNNTKVYVDCVVYDQEKCSTPRPESTNSHDIKIALILHLRVESVSGNQKGEMVELNICSQFLS